MTVQWWERMGYLLRRLPEFLIFASVVSIHLALAAFLLLRRRSSLSRFQKSFITAAAVASMVVLGSAFAMGAMRVQLHFPPAFAATVRTAGTLWALISIAFLIAMVVALAVPKPRSDFSSGRRGFLLATRAAIMSSPALVGGYGVFIERSAFRVREVDVPVPGLARELHGLTLVQLTDIHLSPFLTEKELARAVDMANETRARLALVTGDLITGRGDPLDQCLGQLRRLRAEAGILGCMGNHEVYSQSERYTEEHGARAGIDFLRSRARVLTFNGVPVNIAGVDYQRFKEPYLKGAESLARPGMTNILLSHNPDVFPVAAAKGYQLVIGGHTHGGQISVEILDQNVNVARFYTPYVSGIYRRPDSTIYVSRGIGTVGVPARLGAPPEISLIRLCAI